MRRRHAPRRIVQFPPTAPVPRIDELVVIEARGDGLADGVVATPLGPPRRLAAPLEGAEKPPRRLAAPLERSAVVAAPLERSAVDEGAGGAAEGVGPALDEDGALADHALRRAAGDDLADDDVLAPANLVALSIDLEGPGATAGGVEQGVGQAGGLPGARASSGSAACGRGDVVVVDPLSPSRGDGA